MDEVYSYQIKVPKDRIAVLIGAKGEVKRELQSNAGVKMEVDANEQEVRLSGTDSISLFQAREVISAIARGFNPDIAQLLFRQDYVLETLKLADYAGTKDSQARLKGRVIGQNGKSREQIETMTESFVSVYGKTVSIVGEMAHANVAKRAVEKLLTGQMHATVYKFLEKMRRQLRAEELQS